MKKTTMAMGILAMGTTALADQSAKLDYCANEVRALVLLTDGGLVEDYMNQSQDKYVSDLSKYVQVTQVKLVASGGEQEHSWTEKDATVKGTSGTQGTIRVRASRGNCMIEKVSLTNKY